MKKYYISALILVVTLICFFSCGSGNTGRSGNTCTGRVNPKYHINYFEMCGNSEQPITKGAEKTVTLWLEVDSPFTKNGKQPDKLT